MPFPCHSPDTLSPRPAFQPERAQLSAAVTIQVEGPARGEHRAEHPFPSATSRRRRKVGGTFQHSRLAKNGARV